MQPRWRDFNPTAEAPAILACAQTDERLRYLPNEFGFSLQVNCGELTVGGKSDVVDLVGGADRRDTVVSGKRSRQLPAFRFQTPSDCFGRERY
ncbi:MAG: hypothetical protein ABSH46_18055 [Bryobacteraceae bacterium]